MPVVCLFARLSFAGEPAEPTSGTQIRDYLDAAAAGEQVSALALNRVYLLRPCPDRTRTGRTDCRRVRPP